MSKAIHAREFYVVGGPVQPDRACYVERAADAQLEAAIRRRVLCRVLGPRGIGKSSLMHRLARKLRGARELVAVVDLAQLGALAERESARGWARAFAERVVRELGIETDVGGGWQAAHGDERERLVDFFWRVVLTNTTAPITVLVDGLDAAGDAPIVIDLLAVVERCYARRSAEPDFGRLNFVLVGGTREAEAERGPALSAAATIEPADFSAAECYTLALGFEGETDLAQALMDRVHGWTDGHPYLTQKVARGVLRKGGKLEDVERVVAEQLLAPGAAEADPFLNHVRSSLTTRAPGTRRAARLLRSLAHGRKAVAPADPLVLERLERSGVVAIDRSRRLEFRNRIFKELVGRWLQGVGRVWRLAAAAGVLLVLAAGAGYWYVQYLPTADVATLESATAGPAAVDDAYRRLHGLPGFTERADRLYAAALMRRSIATTTLAAATAVDGRLRGVPGQAKVADDLLAAFWLRRLAEAKHAEQRDAALLYALRASSLPAGAAAATGQLAELVDGDYPRLTRTLHLGAAPATWNVQFADSTLLELDAEHQLQRLPLGAARDGSGAEAPVRLTALQYTALARELAVEGEGSAGVFELTLAVQHPAADQLLVTLTAPSGARATVTVPRSGSGTVESFMFDAARGTPLAALADEVRRGTWRLTVVDRRPDDGGTLAGWALRFGDDTWRDEPPEPLAIPAPTRTDAVAVAVVGTWALVQPQSAGAIGAAALWNLAKGTLENDFAFPVAPRHLAVNAAGSRLIAATDKLVTVWSTGDGALVARLATDTEFVLPPAMSPDGGYFAIAERVDDGKPLYSVIRTDDGSLVGSFDGAPDVDRWWLGPGARYLALQGPANVIRVLGRRGEPLQSLQHAREVVRVWPLLDGATLLTIDSGGAITAWPLGRGAGVRSRQLGVANAAADVSVAADGMRLAFSTPDAAVVVADVATGAQIVQVRDVAPVSARLADDGRELVTWSNSQLRRWDLSGAPPRAAPEPSVAAAVARTVLALDETGRVAIGTLGGRLVIGAADALRTPAPESLEYFGHRGPVTALAVAADHGVAVTGGEDGTVRVWDASGLMPPAVLGRPAMGPITRVSLTANARLVASAAGATVRVAAVADGAVVVERSLAAAVTALAFATDGRALAIGDAGGGLTVVPFDAGRASFDAQLKAPVSAIAFAPDGERLAVGDAAGGLELLQAADGTPVGAPRELLEGVRWLGFSPDGSMLIVATADWLHAFGAAPALAPWQSRFAARSLASAALATAEGTTLRIAELGSTGTVTVSTVDVAGAPMAANPPQRDWPAALGLRLNDAGDPVSYDP